MSVNVVCRCLRSSSLVNEIACKQWC